MRPPFVARCSTTYNIEVGAGLGPLAGKIWRVGLMGASSTPQTLLQFLAACEGALATHGHRVPEGAGVAAASASLRSALVTGRLLVAGLGPRVSSAGGQRVASSSQLSERPNLPWQFTVVGRPANAPSCARESRRSGELVGRDPLLRRPLRILTGVAGVGFGVVSYVYLMLPDVRPLATVNPTSTAFMRLREREADAEGLKSKTCYRWVPYSRISPNLKRAVLVAEDSAFWDHEGIDVEEIRRAIHDGLAKGQAPRGASTITQQLAKNLYLSPSYDPLRKIKELIIARRLEAALSKARIFEIYLNVIEWGDRVWGAEAAARAYFGVPAASLSRQQSALLAGAIVNPRLLTPARPTRRLLRRQRIILARMGSGDQPAPHVASTPDLESDAEAEPAPPTRFPQSVDEEEAEQGGGEAEVPAESAPDTSVEQSPPA